MGIREALNRNPQVTTGATAGIIIVALGLIGWQMLSGGGGSTYKPSNRQFYTVDDGKTHFVEAAGKVVPFQHEGKVAVRARVFTCDGGRTKFVAYLERYSAEAIEHHKRLSGSAGAADAVLMQGIELKRPTDGEWSTVRTPQKLQQIMSVACPDGKGTPEEVQP